MRIYVAHATNYDYVNELYKPIRDCDDLKRYDVVLPHEEKNYIHTRDYYNSFSLAICEVSYPSVGLGIELGFLYDSNIPIYCFYKKDSNYSKSIMAVTKNIIEYTDSNDLVNKIKETIERGNYEA